MVAILKFYFLTLCCNHQSNCLFYGLTSKSTFFSHVRTKLHELKIARQIKSIFHKNRAFGDTSMKFGMDAQNTELF